MNSSNALKIRCKKHPDIPILYYIGSESEGKTVGIGIGSDGIGSDTGSCPATVEIPNDAKTANTTNAIILILMLWIDFSAWKTR